METVKRKPSSVFLKKNFFKDNYLEQVKNQDSQNFSKIAHKLSKKISFVSLKHSTVVQNKKMNPGNNMKRKIDKVDSLEIPDSRRSNTPVSEYSSDEEYGQQLIYNDTVSIQLHQPRSDMSTGG
jgi:thiamine kinase-like enzyme